MEILPEFSAKLKRGLMLTNPVISRGIVDSVTSIARLIGLGNWGQTDKQFFNSSRIFCSNALVPSIVLCADIKKNFSNYGTEKMRVSVEKVPWKLVSLALGCISKLGSSLVRLFDKFCNWEFLLYLHCVKELDQLFFDLRNQSTFAIHIPTGLCLRMDGCDTTEQRLICHLQKATQPSSKGPCLYTAARPAWQPWKASRLLLFHLKKKKKNEPCQFFVFGFLPKEQLNVQKIGSLFLFLFCFILFYTGHLRLKCVVVEKLTMETWRLWYLQAVRIKTIENVCVSLVDKILSIFSCFSLDLTFVL
jgi:hypothetical protein